MKLKGFARPNIIAFFDKDGTTDWKDSEFRTTLQLFNKMGGLAIPTTGRTGGDIEQDAKKYKIPIRVVIADNGAIIIDEQSNETIDKIKLEESKIAQILDKFEEVGGNKDLIRVTDGKNIYATTDREVRKYYKNNKVARFSHDLRKDIKSGNIESLTKITLAGSKDQMQEMADFAEEIGFWTDMDKTKFPAKRQQNIRLDIAEKGINKGRAVKRTNEIFNPIDGYICIGNGWNDLSMFKQAIDDGMVAAIMGDSSRELIEEVKKYQRDIGKGRVIIIPPEKERANNFFRSFIKLYQQRREEEQKKSRRKRLPNVERIDVPRTLGEKSQTMDRRPNSPRRNITEER